MERQQRWKVQSRVSVKLGVAMNHECTDTWSKSTIAMGHDPRPKNRDTVAMHITGQHRLHGNKKLGAWMSRTPNQTQHRLSVPTGFYGGPLAQKTR